jgi:hypothetical protein
LRIFRRPPTLIFIPLDISAANECNDWRTTSAPFLEFRRRPDNNRTAHMTSSRSKAEANYAEMQKRKTVPALAADVSARERADKTARLRALRLAKEAADAAEKEAARDIKAAGKAAFKKGSSVA